MDHTLICLGDNLAFSFRHYNTAFYIQNLRDFSLELMESWRHPGWLWTFYEYFCLQKEVEWWNGALWFSPYCHLLLNTIAYLPNDILRLMLQLWKLYNLYNSEFFKIRHRKETMYCGLKRIIVPVESLGQIFVDWGFFAFFVGMSFCGCSVQFQWEKYLFLYLFSSRM